MLDAMHLVKKLFVLIDAKLSLEGKRFVVDTGAKGVQVGSYDEVVLIYPVKLDARWLCCTLFAWF
jgi:hypothetical protein